MKEGNEVTACKRQRIKIKKSGKENKIGRKMSGAKAS